MRITQIIVEELFGNPTYSYRVELKKDPPITIIHGRNGAGKTVIFKMIAGLFASGGFSPFIFWKYPFSKFEVHFDDKGKLIVTRDYRAKTVEATQPRVSYRKGRGRPKTLDIGSNIVKTLPIPLRRERTTEELIRLLSDLGEDSFDSDSFSPFRDRYLRYGEHWDSLVEEDQWIKDLRSRLDVHFVSTNRLLVRKREKDDRAPRYRRETISSAAAIEENSDDLGRRISDRISEANKIENDLNRTFPSRVVKSVNADNEESWTFDNVQSKLEQLQRERELLVTVGLLEPGDLLKVDQYDDETLGTVLRTYIQDSEQKQDAYKRLGLAERLSLFKKIVQEMLSDKELRLTRDGFVLKSNNGRNIPSKELSSGEQHMIVLMYNLLFRDRRDRKEVDELILIDEPEISLHIAWQRRFVSNLEEISDLEEKLKIPPFDVMIATHSPAIVNGRWDLEVGLLDRSKQSETNHG